MWDCRVTVAAVTRQHTGGLNSDSGVGHIDACSNRPHHSAIRISSSIDPSMDNDQL